MTVYAMAQLSVHDRERYASYAARFMDVLTRYDGRLLAADEQPEVIEGDWPHDKVVLISFADRDAFEKWAYSPEYQEISKDRVAATTGVVILAKGL
ncbi:DUF1330 domain-containing protein [Actinocorallia populi]|uniref:DUF1330 domain-containing protein n=1 Tax=Actinocorallia populi TaxID=2079200 RepID=UPI000D08CC59|nr:DUF1330 domain-containing protein [Actinocorallia populi]